MACGEIPKWEIGKPPRVNGAESTRRIIFGRDPRDGVVIFDAIDHPVATSLTQRASTGQRTRLRGIEP